MPGRPVASPLAGAPPTQPMPKPTVRLTKPPAPVGMGAVVSAPVAAAVLDEEEETADEPALNILSIVTLTLAAIVMLIVLFSSDKFSMAVDPTGNSTSFLKFPAANPGRAVPTDPDGEHFRSSLELKPIPQFEKVGQ
jgi:hypothetical protein